MDDQHFHREVGAPWLSLLTHQTEPERASNQMEISELLDFVVAAAAAEEEEEFVVDNNVAEEQHLQDLDHTKGYRAASVPQTEAAVAVDDDIVVGGTAAVAASCTAASFLGQPCH